MKGKQQQGKGGIPPGTDEADKVAAARLVQERLESSALESSCSIALTGGKKPFNPLSLWLSSTVSSAESMVSCAARGHRGQPKTPSNSLPRYL